jgi:hypothetical protein
MILNFGGYARRLKRMIPNWSNDAKNTATRVANVRAHLAADRMTCTIAEQTVKKLRRQDAPCEHQRFVSIMAMKVVARKQVPRDYRRSLVSGTADVKKCIASAHQLTFATVNLASEDYLSVQLNESAISLTGGPMILRLCNWLFTQSAIP